MCVLRFQIEMRHAAGGANRQRVGEKLRQPQHRVLAAGSADGNGGRQRILGGIFLSRVVASQAADVVIEIVATIHALPQSG